MFLIEFAPQITITSTDPEEVKFLICISIIMGKLPYEMLKWQVLVTYFVVAVLGIGFLIDF